MTDDSNANEATSTPQVQAIVMPLTQDVIERLLQQKSNSYRVADGWTIAWVCGWKVYYNAIDATYRLAVGSGSACDKGFEFGSFQQAYNWVESLTPWQRQMIEANSVSGVSA